MNSIFKPKLYVVLKQGYNRQLFKKDLYAGFIVGIMALPIVIAFAIASGLTPDKGLVTAIIAGLIVSVLGGSRFEIAGPTGVFIVIVYGIVQKYGLDGLMISTIMAGLMLIGFGLLKLGTIIKYIPHPLIVGFTSGIALILFSNQVKDALGLQIDQLPSDFVETWAAYFSNVGPINYFALIITIATVLISIVGGKMFKKVPGSFLAIILVTFSVTLLKLPVSTIQSVFGDIPSTFSFHAPRFELNSLRTYIQPAFTIALLGAIRSLLSAVVADGMTSSTHRSNTELVAQGVANIVTPFFGGFPATGALARTAASIKNGGRTPVAGVVHAITLLLIQRMSKLSNIELFDIDNDIIESYSLLPKGVDVYEISGPFFFAAAQSYKATLKGLAADSKVLILRMRHVPFIDATGIRNFKEVVRDFKIRKVAIILSGVRPKVHQALVDCGLAEEIGNDLICDNFGDAVKKATEELEKIKWFK